MLRELQRAAEQVAGGACARTESSSLEMLLKAALWLVPVAVASEDIAADCRLPASH